MVRTPSRSGVIVADVQGARVFLVRHEQHRDCSLPLRAIHFGTVRFNDKPEARHKCSPGWARFTTRLDVAKLNMRLLSDSLESGTGSSNSLRSTNESLRT